MPSLERRSRSRRVVVIERTAEPLTPNNAAALGCVLAGWERDAADPCRVATLNDALNRLLTDRNARVGHGDRVEDTVKLHSSLRDHSHLHERVSYKLFRELGSL